jgi:hypothetical protein
MDDDEQLVVQLENDAFAESLHGDDALADQVGEWRLDRAEEERRLETHLVERLSDDAASKRLDINGDVGELRHRGGPSCNPSAHYARPSQVEQRFPALACQMIEAEP